MARRPRSSTLENRTNRLHLAPRRKPYAFVPVAAGVALGYRRGKDRNAWVVRVADGKGGNWTKNLPGVPDDHEAADGEHVLDFWQAQDAAKALARGNVDSGRPLTVAEALDAYASELKARGGLASNVTRVRHHLPPGLASKVVSLLTVRELQTWRDGLDLKSAATINRTTRQLKAALNLASRHDPRIINTNAWKLGLASLRDAHRARNTILSDDEVRALIEAAYQVDAAFGLFLETAAITGARPSQLAKLEAGDLQAERDDPRLLMPSSRKGHAGKKIERRPVPIPPSLATKLAMAAGTREASAPLLQKSDGNPWNASSNDHSRPFLAASARIGLKGATFYSLRHSSVVRQILAGTPIRVVAAAHDTSTTMIERSYSEHITDPGDMLLRRGLLDAALPAAGYNIVPMSPKRRS